MSEEQRAEAHSVGTLKIRVRRAGSTEWEDHGTHPIYAEDLPGPDQAAPDAKTKET
jgi:hypothetical protein